MGKHTHDVERLLETIRYHTTRKIKVKGAVDETIALEDLLSRSGYVIRVGRQSAQPDGYPSSTPGSGNVGGGKGSRQLMEIGGRDSDGVKVVELYATSSTEVAALAGSRPDEVADLAEAVESCVSAVAKAYEQWRAHLDRFDTLRSTSKVPDPPMCWVAQVKYQMQWDILWEPWRTTDFAGQIDQPFDEPRRVSQFVYKFVRNHRRLPTKDEMVQYLSKSTIKLRGA